MIVERGKFIEWLYLQNKAYLVKSVSLNLRSNMNALKCRTLTALT